MSQKPPASQAVPPHACRVCGGTASEPFAPREMMFGSGEVFDYFRCRDCGCLQIVDIPEDLSRHYGPGYYSYAGPPRHYGLRARLVRSRDRYLAGDADPLGWAVSMFKPYLALASLRPLGLARDARIVDVGCGGGELLLAMQRAGFTRLVGVDPFVAADLDLGGGLQVRRARLGEVVGLGERDLVMFHHSLEHVVDPRADLQAAHRLLVPGGRCIVRIPTVSSLAWREYGVDWCGLDAPRHLHLHSVDSIRRLATQAGFLVRSVVSDSTAFQFWGSEQYRRGIALMTPGSNAIAPAPGAFTKAQLREFARRAGAANRRNDGDQIVVTLAKPA